MHTVRSGVVKERTALINRLRGILAEFGFHFPQGLAALRRRLQQVTTSY